MNLSTKNATLFTSLARQKSFGDHMASGDPKLPPMVSKDHVAVGGRWKPLRSIEGNSRGPYGQSRFCRDRLVFIHITKITKLIKIPLLPPTTRGKNSSKVLFAYRNCILKNKNTFFRLLKKSSFAPRTYIRTGKNTVFRFKRMT